MSPDDFRVTIRGARWYQDPLPGCTIAPATKDRWPAVSTVKKAWGKPFRKKLPTGDVVPLDAYWAATYAIEHRDEIDLLAPEQAIAEIALASGRTLERAAARGTDIHVVIEDLVAGRDVDEVLLSDEARPYLTACLAFVADCKPTPILAEVVAINRTIGYGGTLDAIIIIDGVTYLVDWKTRSGEHGGYEEEAAQVGAYASAEYIIDADHRDLLPRIDAGLIVSLTETSYELYPIDLDAAADAFREMRDCWDLRRTGSSKARKAIGSPMNPADLSTQRAQWLASRVATLKVSYPDALTELAARWPAGVPTFKDGGHTDDDLLLLSLLISDVEARHSVTFGGDKDPDCQPAPPHVIDALVDRAKNLPTDLAQIVERRGVDLGIPHVRSRGFQLRHVAQVEAILGEVEAMHDARRQMVVDVLAPATDGDLDLIMAIEAACGVDHQAPWTSAQVDRAAAIVLAIDGLWLSYGETDGRMAVVALASTEQRLVELYGSKKDALAACKQIAEAHGLDKPRSVADAAGNPALIAYAAAGASTKDEGAAA